MIDRLPPTYRDAILLSEINGRTQKEVARIHGISLSGAKSRVQRGRAMLKEMVLNCCQLEFDRNGQVVDYKRKTRSPGKC